MPLTVDPDIVRERDVIVFSKGESFTVMVDAGLSTNGWPGGQGVQWTIASDDEPTVTYSAGLFGGFLIWGSNESADQYTAMTGNQLAYGHAVMMAGRAVISTSSYERFT